MFEAENITQITNAQVADATWTFSEREHSEELYGDYQIIVDDVAERLYDFREQYATSLDEETAEEYRAVFNRGALDRFRRFSGFLVDES